LRAQVAKPVLHVGRECLDAVFPPCRANGFARCERTANPQSRLPARSLGRRSITLELRGGVVFELPEFVVYIAIGGASAEQSPQAAGRVTPDRHAPTLPPSGAA
jgi:hypothetical protein